MTLKFYTIAVTAIMLGVSIFPGTTGAINSPRPPLDIFVSSESLLQADTLLTVVRNEPADISGKLGGVRLRFFRSEANKDWIALTGIPINKKPGTYRLLITVPGKTPFERNITVSKRNFPVTSLIITPDLKKKGYTPKKIIDTIQNEENKALQKVLGTINPVAYFSKPFINPLSEIIITGPYGDVRASNYSKIQHLGVDLKAPISTPVFAVNDGNIVFVKYLPDYGNTIIIDHGLGVYSLYLHLSEFKGAEGQLVKQGQIIALSGNTGYAAGPHLHFSIKVRGASLDPLKFIQASQITW